MRFLLIYLMNSFPIIFVFNIIICCTWNICPRPVEQATQATTQENPSPGFPTKASLKPVPSAKKARLKIEMFSQEASLGTILIKKQTTKLLMRLRGCAGWSGPLLLQIPDRFSQSQSNCYICHLTMTHIRNKMRNLIIVKYDNLDRIVICAVSSKHLQWI